MTELTSSNVRTTADEWVVRMHSDQVTLEDERCFGAWLASDPAHAKDYENAHALWRGMGALRDDPDAIQQLSDVRELTKAPSVAISRRSLLAASLAGGVSVAGVGIGWDAFFGSKAYATEVGEQQSVVLDDGSKVTLNTDSAMRVRFDKHERRIWLDKGQAFFAVASEPRRPFRVFVGANEMRAETSAFDIRRTVEGAQVSLEAGTVEVFKGDQAPTGEGRVPKGRPAATLKPGDRAAVTSAVSVGITRMDTRQAGAWRFGRMILDGEPLGDAVQEINRYNTRQIILLDPSLNDIPISGVFQTGRPDAFIEALEAAFPVRISSRSAQTVALESREQRP